MSWWLDAVYCLLALGAIPYWLWGALRYGKYRDGWGQKLWGTVPPAPTDRPVVWLHAVSLGEVNLLGTLIAGLLRQRPDLHVYITTTTRTGFESACKRYAATCQVSYFPFDFRWAVRRALLRIRPSAIVLAELEIWPNLIHFATQAKIPVIVANGRLSPGSFRGYWRIRRWLRPVFQRLTYVAAQTDEYAARFRALGTPADRIRVTGSLKFDGAESNRLNARTAELRRLAGYVDDQVIWLAGSTFPPEEERVIEVFSRLRVKHPELRLILVPRHPERFDTVAELLDQSQMAWTRRSQLSDGQRAAEILLVDTIGELGAWWGTADLAFVGGSMGPRGGQNMIEPAAYGAAVCFGPQTTNFRDVVQLMLQQDAAEVVRDGAEIQGFLERGLTDPLWRRELGDRAAALVRRNQGATQRTVEILLPLLPLSRDLPAGCQTTQLALIV